MKQIQSKKNILIKETKKLYQKKYRKSTGCYLIDGLHLLQEAIRSKQKIQNIFVTDKGLQEARECLRDYAEETYLIADEVAKELSDLPTPQGIFAVIKLNDQKLSQLSGKWIILDNVQDPGNVGTIIRTADAAGFSGVFLGNGTADCYSSKVLRSMQGSQFHLPVITGEVSLFIEELKENGFTLFGTELNAKAVDYRGVSPISPLALVVGNEGQGVQKQILQQMDQNLYIPLYGQAESLNVGVAAGILMYHFV